MPTEVNSNKESNHDHWLDKEQVNPFLLYSPPSALGE